MRLKDGLLRLPSYPDKVTPQSRCKQVRKLAEIL
jgi:hypothetical protein